MKTFRGLSVWLLLLAVTAGAITMGGCESTQRRSRRKNAAPQRVYYVVVSEDIPTSSAKVIVAVTRAIASTKLELISSSTTNIDAFFHVQSALRKEFKIMVVASTHHRTRLAISALDKADRGMATIIFGRITSNLPDDPNLLDEPDLSDMNNR